MEKNQFQPYFLAYLTRFIARLLLKPGAFLLRIFHRPAATSRLACIQEGLTPM